VTKGRNNDA